jgi:chorismate mutase
MSDIADDPVVQDLRERITANDLAILAAVNLRIELVAELWGHKEKQGYARLDQAREASMLELLVRENAGPLTASGLRHFYAALIELTKREALASRSVI